MIHTLRCIIKSSILKLLCTLTRICKETIVQSLQIDSFGSTLPCIPSHYFNFSLFAVRTTEQGERRKSHQNDPLPILNNPTTSPPPHFPLIPRQGNIYAALCHSASLRASGGTFPLRFAKYFYPCTHLVLPSVFTRPVPFISPPRVSDVTDVLLRLL